MLRYATGSALANEGVDTRLIQDFLGHVDIRHTARRTALSPRRLAAVRVRWSAVSAGQPTLAVRRDATG
jgi:site-specific recombinase XerD